MVSGQPAEVAMFLFGRSRHRGLTYDGPPDAVRALQEGRLELSPAPAQLTDTCTWS